MLAVRLPSTLARRLAHLASKTGRTKTYYVKEAIKQYLEDREDYLLAVSVLEKRNPAVPIEKAVKELDLED